MPPIYSIGEIVSELTRFELPTNQNVLSYFKYQQQISPTYYSIRQITTTVVDDIYSRWNLIEINLRDKRNSIVNLERLYGEWKSLQKSQYRPNSRACKKRKESS